MNKRIAWLMLGLVTATLLVTAMLLMPATGSASPSQGACFASHNVQRGETVAQIARHYGVSVSAIVQANPHLANPDRVYPGQKLCIPGDGAPPPPPGPAPSHVPPKGNTVICVSGQVIDKNHQGIEGLQVVAEAEGQSGIAVNADADGRFEFEELAAGTWTFRVAIPDSWRAVTSAEFTMDLSYDKVGCYDVRFKLEPLGCVIVYKKDSEGNPLPLWPVRISGPIDPEATTDEDGVARFNELVPGTYLVEEEVLYPWKPLTPSRVAVAVEPAMSDDDCVEVEFVNEEQPTSCITGQKVDDLHHGVAGWTIRARSAEGYEAEPQITDEEGYFTFENLTLGKWTLWEEVQDGWTPVTSPMFSVVLADENKSSECVTVRFKNRPPDLCAEGFKVDENGNGLAGWKVFAYPASSPDMRIETLTDGNGRFRFNGLTLEEWVFEVEGQVGWTPIGDDSIKMPITPGKHCTQVPIFRNQSPRGCVEGYKRDDLQVGLPGWNISLQPVGGGKYVHAETDGTGYFRFDNLPAGEYEVWEEMQPGWSALTPRRQIVEITPSDEFVCERLEFVNKQTPRDICIDGYKLDQHGDVGLPGVPVTAVNVDTGEEMEVMTDGQGYFRFLALEPGAYEVSVEEPEGWIAVGPSTQMVKVDWPPKLHCATVTFYDRQEHMKPQPPPPPPPDDGTSWMGSCGAWHTVKSGDTMAKIAAHYHVGIRAITYANHIKNANVIYKGQELCIPDP